MRKSFTILLAVIIAVALLAGCQATPEKEIVIQKDLEQMLEKAGATDTAQTPGISLRERTGAPETLTLEDTKGNFTLSVDAVVMVPDSDRMPIIRVEAGEFTQEQVTAYWNALVGDTVLCAPQAMTKSEIEEQLLIYQGALAQLDENEPGDEESRDLLEATIANLESLCQTAPDGNERTQADSTLYEITETNTSGGITDQYMGTIGIAEGDTMRFEVKNSSYEYQGEATNPPTMSFSTEEANYNYGQTGTIELDGNTQLDESLQQYIQTTPPEALALIEDLFKKTNTPMVVASMKLVNDEQTGIYDGIVAPPERYAYRIECVRVVDDTLPCARVEGVTSVATDEDPMYWKQCRYEKMTFMVNDDGIIEMEWIAPLNILETKVEDSALMPFSEIQSVFEKMMGITFEARSAGLNNLKCDINEISLGMMRIVEQNSIENGLLAPVWNFYGQEYWTTADGNTEKRDDGILLCVNAIDGSVIDTGKGY